MFDITAELVPPEDKAMPLQAFAVTLSIAVLMLLNEKIEDKLEVSVVWIDAVVRFLICCIVVFVEGGLFGWFDFTISSFAYIAPTLIPVFIITYFISYLTCVEFAETINNSIKGKKQH